MIINIILFILIGLALLVIGADLLVKGASNIAKKYNIPETLIGLSIVAIGTSLPELIITVTSAKKNAIDLIVGNSIGSDLCNLLLILGLMALIRPIEINKETKKIHIPVAFLSTIIILSMALGFWGSKEGIITRYDGIILIFLFAAYIIYPIIMEIKDIVETFKNNKNKEKEKINVFISIIFILSGCVLLKYGGDFVVDNATKIAEICNISQRVIGLTIIAIGTALPELFTSIIAIASKDTDLAIGNLIGSSVLNSFLILGLGSMIVPLTISQEFKQNLILLAMSTLIIWIFTFLPKENFLTRWKGLVLVSLFIFYMISLFI